MLGVAGTIHAPSELPSSVPREVSDQPSLGELEPDAFCGESLDEASEEIDSENRVDLPQYIDQESTCPISDDEI